MSKSAFEVLLDAASTAVSAAPLGKRYLVADLFTSLVPFVAPHLFRRTRDNFAYALGIGNRPRASQLARASLRNFGRMAVDFLWIRTLADHQVAAVTELSGDDHLGNALGAGRGAVLVLPHMGCWDVAAARASASGVRIAIVTEGTWAARLTSASRRRPGVSLVPRDRSVRPLLDAIRHNQGVVLLSDLARPGLQTCEVPFFGRIAALPSGPARLSARTRAPIVAVACVRTAPCRYRVEFRPPIWPQATTVAREASVQTTTAQIARDFENLIRQYPDQWYPFGRIWTPTGRTAA